MPDEVAPRSLHDSEPSHGVWATASSLLPRGRGSTGGARHSTAVADVLAAQERVRQCEWEATRQELDALLDVVPSALVARLLRDLTSLSAAAMRALAEIEALQGPEVASSNRAVEATTVWLSTAAEALRSAQAAHMALGAHQAVNAKLDWRSDDTSS